MRCTENCNACSWRWSTERAQFFSMTMPDCTSYNQCFKSWTNWATKFCLICDIHLTLANQLPLLQPSRQLFAGKMLPQPAGGRKCFPRVRQILKHKFFTLQEWTNLFLVGKTVLIVTVPILFNKDVFEPIYSDLKFLVWNHSYFFTNLIRLFWICIAFIPLSCLPSSFGL